MVVRDRLEVDTGIENIVVAELSENGSKVECPIDDARLRDLCDLQDKTTRTRGCMAFGRCNNGRFPSCHNG